MPKCTTSHTIHSQFDRAHTALAQATTDLERLIIRDQAKVYQAAAEILNLCDIQVQASILVQAAERAISKANPPLVGGGDRRSAEFQAAPSTTLEKAVPQSTIRGMRAAHSKLTDDQFEARTVQAVESETPLTRQSLKAPALGSDRIAS